MDPRAHYCTKLVRPLHPRVCFMHPTSTKLQRLHSTVATPNARGRVSSTGLVDCQRPRAHYSLRSRPSLCPKALTVAADLARPLSPPEGSSCPKALQPLAPPCPTAAARRPPGRRPKAASPCALEHLQCPKASPFCTRRHSQSGLLPPWSRCAGSVCVLAVRVRAVLTTYLQHIPSSFF